MTYEELQAAIGEKQCIIFAAHQQIDALNIQYIDERKPADIKRNQCVAQLVRRLHFGQRHQLGQQVHRQLCSSLHCV